jgi:hypothetical protein
MSSFVTGLVRRAAGIPQPVSIRPAVGPAQIPVFPSTASQELEGHQEVLPPPDAAERNHNRESDFERGRPVFPGQAVPASESHPQPGAAPEPVKPGPKLPVKREETTQVLLPRIEAAATPVTASPVLREDRWLPHLADEAPVVPPLAPAATPEHQDRPTPPPAEAQRKTARLEPGPPLETVSAGSRPLPGPESIAAPSVQPARPAAASGNRERSEESRSIQVKIGKVEIRSPQPAPVVRANPRLRTTGFDDLRLSRTYLDRSTR